jgi:hypothetical protein
MNQADQKSDFGKRTVSHGFALVQALVYIPVMAILIYVTVDAALVLKKGTRGMQAGATRIFTAMNAGELWRADVRLATSPPQSNGSNRLMTLNIQQGTNAVIWSHSEGQVWRQAGTTSPRVTVLRDVSTSTFQRDRRKHVTAWKWEIAFKRARLKAKTQPLYTFISVPLTSESK